MNALDPPKRSAPGREIAGAAKLRLPLFADSATTQSSPPVRRVRDARDQPLARRLVRRSALTAPVWCLDCADYPRQLLLNLGTIG